MDPTVLSDTCQEFDGIKYYISRKYYKTWGRRKRGDGPRDLLHVKVWEHANGSVPEGFHIHHKNRDTSDNRLVNLECLSPAEHIEEHRPELVPLATVWHRSDEGRKWHREHALKVAKTIQPVNKPCAECGASFQTKANRSNVRFCQQNCKQRAFNRRNPSYKRLGLSERRQSP